MELITIRNFAPENQTDVNKILKSIPVGVSSILMMIIIYYLSQASDPLGASNFTFFKNADKIVHFIMYFALTWVFIIDYCKGIYPHHPKLSIVVALMVVAALFGWFMEVLQGINDNGRNMDNSDMVANALGALFGFAFTYFLFMHRFRRMMREGHHHSHHHSREESFNWDDEEKK